MLVKRTTRKSQAVLFTECLIAMTILGMLLVGFWYSLSACRTFNHIQMARLRCTAAAEAQLDSLTATGRAMDDATIQKLWPGVKLYVTRTPGENKWIGLTRLHVRADAVTQGRDVRMDFSRYISPSAGRGK
jgi:type II secretory pathway pseudopilin PulG